MGKLTGCLLATVIAILVFLATVGAWCVHIVYCFQHHEWIRLLVLAILAPLGVLDGWGIFFHWW